MYNIKQTRLTAESSWVRFVYIILERPSGEPLLPTDGEDAVYFRMSMGLKTTADARLGRQKDNDISNTQKMYNVNVFTPLKSLKPTTG